MIFFYKYMYADYSRKFESTTDYAGHVLFGLDGSLTSYINTGNPYYNIPKQKGDCFVNSKKEKTKKILKIGAITLASIAGLLALKKICKFKLPNGIGEKIKNIFKKVPESVIASNPKD